MTNAPNESAELFPTFSAIKASAAEVLREVTRKAGRDMFARRLGFGPTRTTGAGATVTGALGSSTIGGPVFWPQGLIHIAGQQPGGGPFDFNTHAGEPLANSVVAACVNAIAQALPDAPVYLEKRNGQNWDKVHDHPALDSLRWPNEYHSAADVWGLTVGQERTRGQAFWIIPQKEKQLNANRKIMPAQRKLEIWPVESDKVTIEGTEDEFIARYWIQSEKGEAKPYDNSEVIHFRHMLNWANPRGGWAPILTGRRQIAGDNGAAIYHSAILHNSGVMSLLVTLKDAAAAGSVTPGQIEKFVTALKEKLFGVGAGGIAGLNLPLDVHKMSYSPDEMALSQLISYYETRIAILIGVDPMVTGLGSGTTQKTYANFAEAIEDFWRRCIVPMRNRHAATLTAQYLPLFGLDPSQWRVAFDYSNVAALQEDADSLHGRVREDWKAQLLDKKQARTLLGYAGDEPDEAQFEGVFFGGSEGSEDEPETTAQAAPENVKAWNEAAHSRDERGRFAHEMTNSEYVNANWREHIRERLRIAGLSRDAIEKDARNHASRAHEKMVGDAVLDGKDVPAHVLADYDHLNLAVMQPLMQEASEKLQKNLEAKRLLREARASRISKQEREAAEKLGVDFSSDQESERAASMPLADYLREKKASEETIQKVISSRLSGFGFRTDPKTNSSLDLPAGRVGVYRFHYNAVKEALLLGESVPDNVLKDYPGLKEKVAAISKDNRAYAVQLGRKLLGGGLGDTAKSVDDFDDNETKTWNEAEHPRNEKGEFADGHVALNKTRISLAVDSLEKGVTASAEHLARHRDIVSRALNVAHEHGYIHNQRHLHEAMVAHDTAYHAALGESPEARLLDARRAMGHYLMRRAENSPVNEQQLAQYRGQWRKLDLQQLETMRTGFEDRRRVADFMGRGGSSAGDDKATRDTEYLLVLDAIINERHRQAQRLVEGKALDSLFAALLDEPQIIATPQTATQTLSLSALPESELKTLLQERGLVMRANGDDRKNTGALLEVSGKMATVEWQNGHCFVGGHNRTTRLPLSALTAVKRYDPTQARGDDGKWTAGGSGGASSNVTTEKAEATRDLKAGTIEEAKALGVVIPKGSTNIQIATDPKNDVLAQYTQTSGKPRTVYSKAWDEKQAEAKFQVIEQLHADLPKHISAIDKEIADGGANAHQALTLRLILKTGLRNGGDGGGGKVKAYGASSLRTEHAKVDGDRISLDFIGKEGVRQRHTFHDTDLAAHIKARQEAGHETIFDSDAKKTLKYWQSQGGRKVHDLRTLYGTGLAAARVEHINEREGAPKTEKELKAQINRVAKIVGAHLGNDAKQSLSNYIAPQVFEAWKNNLKKD